MPRESLKKNLDYKSKNFLLFEGSFPAARQTHENAIQPGSLKFKPLIHARGGAGVTVSMETKKIHLLSEEGQFRTT